MQKLQDSVFALVKTSNLSPAVFSFLQPTDDSGDKTPLGGIFKDTKRGWLALGPKFCVVDLRTGMKVAARTFGATLSNNATVTSVVELPTPLTESSRQLIISLQCDDISSIVILNINGSQILRCIQTDVVVTQLAICDQAPDGILTCFDGVVIAGTKRGEIFAFDLNRATLIKALKDISQGYEHLIQNELKPTNLSFLPLDALHRIEEQRELALENHHHLAVLLNENSFIDGQYIFRNPDGSVRMKAKRDHIRVTVLEYITQTGSVAVGFNFGAFQIWNLMTLHLEYTSQVNVECLPVTHFGFQEPCDDPRAFCYLWVIFSVIDRYEEEEFPLAVMYSLTYQGKRMLSDTKCLYQDFTSATIRFQIELNIVSEAPLLGGKCISCHTYSIKSALGDEGEDNMLNLCQLVWECWAEDTTLPIQYGMLLFDLDQWYKDQMPSTHQVCSNAFLSFSGWSELGGGSSVALHARLDPASVAPYSHATRLEEHFYPNSLHYKCICLSTSEACVLSTMGIQRQIIASLENVGPTALLHPTRLYAACVAAGLQPLLAAPYSHTQEDQRKYLLSVALEARLARFLKRCAHDWATGSHSGVGCTLPFLVDWCWQRAIELKEHAKELTAPLFTSSALPDRNIVRCLEHCVQQLTQLTGLMDAILTKCCNLVVPDALSEMEEKHKGIGTVSLYFQVVQWFLRVGLLPERVDGSEALPYPTMQLYGIYNKRRLKLNRLQDGNIEENSAHKSCVLLYIDQLLEQEFGGERIHQMWIKGGSECRGLYPPPSLYALLRLYLLPDIAEEHKHSLVLYLLVDYSMIYDDVRYETVIRRLMQFPTMFGLSNTAIKATQAFWHLDHRDFDFALDQLQCLTGNTLSQWQHNVVLSSLLAQKKTQAALQYLHVRKPAPIQNIKDGDYSKVNDYDKLEDWQSCVNLYLARGLVYEALDVIRMCVQNAGSLNDKTQVLNMFFKGCRNTGNLAKILSVCFLPLEEETFIKYLENCNDPHTSDILIMYYLQQSRYLEAERYNAKLRRDKPKSKDINNSMESLYDNDRDNARDKLVEAMCYALPSIAETVAHCAFEQKDIDWHVHAPKPMSVYVQAKSPKNSFTYKSSFIQDTIQNASETWVNRPQIRKGLKRMLNIEETPFICTPKLSRSKRWLLIVQRKKKKSMNCVFGEQSESTPAKRARLNLSGTPRTPRSAFKVSDKISSQMEMLLDMPEVQSPVGRIYERPETPHSILKLRRNSRSEAPSPTCSRYLDDTDDELEMETASNHTHYSDSTNKHLRFTIPTPTELCTEPTPSPVSSQMSTFDLPKERERSASTEREKELDISTAESYVTTASHAMNESNPLESPPKKLATEANIAIKKAYKDSVRARRSLSISANSSLSDDPNTSIESIADIPITLINPRYSGTRRRRSQSTESRENKTETQEMQLRYVGARESMSTERTLVKAEREMDVGRDTLEVPKTPRGRRGIRASGESTPLRSGSITPERQDSPAVTPLRSSRISRSRSKTPELSPRSSPLAPILEQPKQEIESESQADISTLNIPRSLRSRSRTPERMDKGVSESPRLEAIKESPTKSGSDSPPASPSRRSLRSRSRTPEVEVILEPVVKPSSRSLRSRSKTPEKLMSPKKEQSVRTKKSLSRLVLEANTFAKTKQTLETLEAETNSEMRNREPKETAIECTPMKSLKQTPNLMDVTLSPIVNKSILQSSNDSVLSESVDKEPNATSNRNENLMPLPAFSPLRETYFEKSVLRSYQSSVGDFSQSIEEKEKISISCADIPPFTAIHEEFGKSVLHSFESSIAESSHSIQETTTKKDLFKSFSLETPAKAFESVLHSDQSSDAQALNVSSLITDDSDVEMKETKQDRAEQNEKQQIVEIDREIHEIEDMSNNESEGESDGGNEASSEESDEGAHSFNDAAANVEAAHVSSDSDSDESAAPVVYEKPELVSAAMLDKYMETDFKSKETDDSSMSQDVESISVNSSVDEKTSEDDSSSGQNQSETDDSNESNKVEVISDESDETDETQDKELPMETRKEGSPTKMDVAIDNVQSSVLTEDNSVVFQVSAPTEATNPLDQAQISIMTDDNSTIIEDVEITEPNKVSSTLDTDQKLVEVEASKHRDEKETKTEIPGEAEAQEQEVSKKALDPLAEVSLMTEDNSDSEQEISLHYSDEKIEIPEEKTEVPAPEPEPMTVDVPTSSIYDVIDKSVPKTEKKEVATAIEMKNLDIEPAQKLSKIEVMQETSNTETANASKQETVKETPESITIPAEVKSIPNLQETSKLETVKESTVAPSIEKMDTESSNIVTKPETKKETSKSETAEGSKQEAVKETPKSKSIPAEVQSIPKVQESSKLEAVKDSTVAPIIEKMDTESHNLVTKPEIKKDSSKSETDKASKSAVEKMKTDTQIAPETSKPEIVTTTLSKAVVEKSVEKMDTNIESQSSEQEPPKQIRTRKRIKSTSSNSEIEPKETDEPKTSTRKRAQSITKSTDLEIPKESEEKEQPSSSSTSEAEPKASTSRKRTQSRTKSTEIKVPKDIEPTSSSSEIETKVEEPQTPVTRKRAQSRAKSTDDPKDGPKTPTTRKRASKTTKPDEMPIIAEEQIISSSKTDPEILEETKTPRKRTQSTQSEETDITPSRRTKTPTEIRKIVTRRMSREMREHDDSNLSLDDLTPKRRTKKSDDNESVASEGSMTSSVSEGKSRRGRKSTVATKPDLSVIPEVVAEHSTLDAINEYSGARRLTRNQRALLETSRARASYVSRASRSSVSEQEDEEERQPAFDLQPIDRISLLNKESYDGPPDEDELQLSSMSPESIASDASRMRSRMARASSEAKVVRAAKIHRRIASVDVADLSPLDSPVLSGTDSPARGRRASFNRAVEALHTPKGRRTSTDSRRSDVGSPVDSPATSEAEGLTTPARRGRRASTQSNTSQTGRTRSKKMTVLEEVKETKK